MVTASEERQWLRHLMPLPHEIAVTGETAVAPADIAIRLRAEAGEVERHAAPELEALFVEMVGVQPSGSRFEIAIGVADAQGELEGTPIEGFHRLGELPHREQAYVIHPVGDSRLVLAALDERGVCYAVRTLMQLLEPKLSESRLSIPLVTITDWPVLDERGMWNFPDPDSWIPWMSSLKLSFGKMASTELDTVERGKPNRARIDTELMEAGRLRAFNYVPYILHLNFSTTTQERDHKILAELPAEVKVERACATELERVHHIPRDLMANPLYDHYASEGRWIASYDVPVGASGRVDTPEFKVPHRSAHRIRDYVGQLVRRRYSGAYGMMAWATKGREICGYNICALAEWSWNLDGRTEREFATAWATREGFEDRDAVADWAELMGPVEFDVYDSDFPICYSWGKALETEGLLRRVPILATPEGRPTGRHAREWECPASVWL